jgi:hypothetical protein
MQARFGREMLDTVIRRDAALREAAAYGVPVRKLDPAARGALDHDALARELMDRSPAFRGAPVRLPLERSGAHALAVTPVGAVERFAPH